MDGHYLVLNPGDQVLLSFEGYQEIPVPGQAWAVTRGYYLPLGEDISD